MTSESVNTECFVYITLPRESKSVTAGRFVLSKERDGSDLGSFVYGRTYLSRADAVEIDPIELKLISETFVTKKLSGIFGAMRDAGPDFWGRVVIEKHLRKGLLAELDYLLNSPDDRAGALGFGLGKDPPMPKSQFNQTIELLHLQKIAQSILREQTDPQDEIGLQVQELLLIGTSMGGARPKTVVEDDAGLWVAKFSRPDDRWNNPRVEHAMLELARKCGITTAGSRIETVGGKDILLVQRFDRKRMSQGYARARMISALTVLRADEAERGRWSYVVLAEELRKFVSEPKKDAAELFRRMCFNALISNIDDHPRNHAFIAMDRQWKLSPAYDLTPSPAVSQDNRDLAMVCGDFGRFANAKNLLTQATRFLLDKNEAERIVSDMTALVRSTWYKAVRAAGVSENDVEKIKSAFVYPGFERE